MQKKASPNKKGLLTLGWRVDPTLAPKYWLDPEAKPGSQTEEDLVRVPGESMGCHTAIAAQSGSGKSFFLGRLIEELVLETKARCVILDPNADFRRVAEVVDANRWAEAKYNRKTARGFLPHESKRDVFAERWSAVEKTLLGGSQLGNEKDQQLRLSWPSLSVEFLSEDIAPMLRSDLYHCHEFVKAIVGLLALKHWWIVDPADAERQQEQVDPIEYARRLLRRVKGESIEDRRETLEKEFSFFRDIKAPTDDRLPGLLEVLWRIALWPIVNKGILQHEVDRAIVAVEYISDDVERYYFGKAKEYVAQGIVRTDVCDAGSPPNNASRIQIIDLPSFTDLKTKLLALNSVLAQEWNRARGEWTDAITKSDSDDIRVPTFIIIDEAHNLIPQQPRGLAAEALREQFRTIAAEGRKYGLFLIICTQRPDKIDPLVLSECENRAIMKLGSRSVLDITETLFGLEDVPSTTLRKCLEFKTGRALLIGRWAKTGPELLYTAMRRTVEGGRSLQDKYWATPFDEQKVGAKSAKNMIEESKINNAKKTATKDNQR